jgi:proline dehydrogenase
LALLDRALVQLLPVVPRPIVRRIAARYIAGEEIDDAVATVAELNEDGMTATIDVLGEEIHNAQEAQEIVDAYHDTLDAIGEHGLDANVSVKPTAVGLKLGYDVGSANVEALVRHAAETGNFVRIDMEDSTTTDDTLRMYRELRDAGLDNVGVVLQARLRRAHDEVVAPECADELTEPAKALREVVLPPVHQSVDAERGRVLVEEQEVAAGAES